MITIPKSEQNKIKQVLANGFGAPIVSPAILLQKNLFRVDKPDRISFFGTPVYDTMFIERPEVTTYEYNPTTKEYKAVVTILSDDSTSNSTDSVGGKLGVLISGCLIDVNQQKNIITTSISGSKNNKGEDYIGTVKEYIGMGDFSVSVRGFVASPSPYNHPKIAANALASYLNASVPLKINSYFLNRIFGVTTLVITGYRMWQQEGMRNIQYFDFQALSDEPFVIEDDKNV